MHTLYKKTYRFFVPFLVLFLACALLPIDATASEVIPSAQRSSDTSVIFHGLDQLAPGESLEYETTDENGDDMTIGIQNVSMTRATQRWKIWHNHVTISDGYYINMSNNKITGADSWWISVLFGTWSNRTLSYTSKMSELKFQYSMTMVGIPFSSTAWLRADVTGSNNDVKVTWGS